MNDMETSSMHASIDRVPTMRDEEDGDDRSPMDMSLTEEEDVESFHDEKEKVVIATNETRKVGYLRVALMLVLMAVAGIVSAAVYNLSREIQQNEFETYAMEACQKVATSFQSSAARRLTAIASLAKSISSNAAARGESWPNVSVPDFEERVSLTLDLADVMSITMLPVVTGEHLNGWNEYSVQNAGWFNESLEYQVESGANHSEWSDDVEAMKSVIGEVPPDYPIAPGIYSFEGGYYDAETDEGPFLPWWQFAPVFPVPALINYDTATNPSRKYQLKGVLENCAPLVSQAWDYSDTENPDIIGKQAVLNLFLKRWEDGGKSYQKGPVSDLYYPVFDGAHKDEDKVAAVLTAYVYWQVYFSNVLAPMTEPVVAVLENICGGEVSQYSSQDHLTHRQQFTYKITGEEATYIGPGDLHDEGYDYLEESTGWHAFLAGNEGPDGLMEGQCIYQVRVYPTKEMEDNLKTIEPLAYMLVVLGTFLVTSLIFCLYDYYVERRQRVVMTKAIKSTEVVQELFPENVRGRLLGQSYIDTSSSKQHKPDGALRIRDGSSQTNSSLGSLEIDQLGRVRGDMVADLYQNCTVLFADIAGFTQWSSNREPTHVFHLLETLYRAFDRIAKQRRVFKVETIGDCYLAITGVPRPQRDHALTMVKFAAACVEKMHLLILNQLTEELGEETGQLQLRVGIHSGAVTAGVLRGNRARFQLFGDTVNTASRMESNSLPGKIQVSSETADLLKAAGKDNWLTPREGGIEAKGKGVLETYWIATQHTRSSRSGSVSTAGMSVESQLTDDEFVDV